MNMPDLDKVEFFLKKEKIKYKNIKNYELPFFHSSYTHETPEDDESYDRLEFLGDSILGEIVSKYLYLNFPKYDQGDMTLIKHHVVNKEYLASIGRKLNFEKLMWLGAGENREDLSDSVYADVFESLVGAIYLDAGYNEVYKWIYKYILKKINTLKLNETKDPKTRLQEMFQAEGRKSIKYNTSEGIRSKENIILFTSKAIFDEQIIGIGNGSSKKEAEKNAAKNAIERMA